MTLQTRSTAITTDTEVLARDTAMATDDTALDDTDTARADTAMATACTRMVTATEKVPTTMKKKIKTPEYYKDYIIEDGKTVPIERFFLITEKSEFISFAKTFENYEEAINTVGEAYE